MIPSKYPKRTDHNTADWTTHWRDGELFQVGSARAHADYLIEMKARSPVMYFLWYRWWIPSLLHEEERVQLEDYLNCCRRIRHRSYWAAFSLHHPVLFLLYFLFIFFFQITVKFLTAPIKVIGRFFKSQWTSSKSGEALYSREGVDNTLAEDKFIEQDGNMP